MSEIRAHRYRVSLDDGDPQERLLGQLLDSMKPRHNGRSEFQKKALLHYMVALGSADLNALSDPADIQLAIQVQMLYAREGLTPPVNGVVQLMSGTSEYVQYKQAATEAAQHRSPDQYATGTPAVDQGDRRPATDPSGNASDEALRSSASLSLPGSMDTGAADVSAKKSDAEKSQTVVQSPLKSALSRAM